MYFLKSVNISKAKSGGLSLKLKPLPGQFFSDSGKAIIDSMNVSGNLIKTQKTTKFAGNGGPEWKKYPEGTIFVASNLVDDTNGDNSTPYYIAPENLLFVVSPDPTFQPLIPEHMASEQILREWQVYRSKNFASLGVAYGDAPSSSTTQTCLFDELRTNKVYAPPTIDQHGFSISERDWYLLVRNIIKKVNFLIFGYTGTGKTDLVRVACERLGKPLRIYDMGQIGKDTESCLCGVHRIGPDGRTYFDKAKFTEDIQKPGVILLDEISRAADLNILFPVLDSRRYLELDKAESASDRIIHVHKDCMFIATANVGCEYTGTTSLDEALLNRFSLRYKVDYLPANDEIKLLVKRSGISDDEAGMLVNTANKIRHAWLEGSISHSVSTRETLAAADLIYDGWGPTDSMEAVYLPIFDGTKAEGEMNAVAQMILSN